MLLGIPVICLILGWRFFWLRGAGWRTALLSCVVLAGFLAVISVELLSACRWLSPAGISVFWALVLGGLLVVQRPRSKMAGGARPGKFTGDPWIAVSAVIGLAGVTFVVALVAAPNTWDSMTYHLPRVMHWAQNASVGYYPTAISRQNENPSGAEVLLLHLYLLTGNDRLFNLVQWGGYIGSAVACSLAAGFLGAPVAGQWLAALSAMSIPMVVLQSTSTQTDLAAAGWIMTALVFLYRRMNEGRRLDLVLAGLSAGLAVMTKGTVAVFLPFLLFFIIFSFRRRGKKALLDVLVIGLCVALIMGGWVWRYGQAARQGLLVREAEGLFLKDREPGILASNVIKQAASECVLPFRPVVEGCARVTAELHRALGIKVDDERTTGGPIRHMFLIGMALDEDYAGNFLHLLVFTGIAVVGLFIGGASVRWYALCWFGVMLLFGAVFKWQPWINRLHVPGLIAAAPLAGAFLGRFRVAGWLLSAVFLFMGLTAALYNNTRPLVGANTIWNVSREQQYYWKKPFLFEPYGQVAGLIKARDCRNVGLRVGGDSWEYPWWALLGPGVRIEHVDPGNTRALYPGGPFEPCAVIDIMLTVSTPEAVYNGRTFVKAGEGQNLVVYFLRKDG